MDIVLNTTNREKINRALICCKNKMLPIEYMTDVKIHGSRGSTTNTRQNNINCNIIFCLRFKFTYMAGRKGFEPLMAVPKTAVLPLH